VASNSVTRVFIVDGESVIASSLVAILKLHGFCALSFTSGSEALEAARSRAPDLLISEVLMPGVSGIDLAIQIKAQYPDCKILIFSGQAFTQDLLEHARRQGHDFELLRKPVHPFTMLASIRALAAAAGRRPVLPD
jgi:DNA-binding NtrC family response regulator